MAEEIKYLSAKVFREDGEDKLSRMLVGVLLPIGSTPRSSVFPRLIFLAGMPDLITWPCHICKQERPDDKISVWTTEHEKNGIVWRENVRYCNDNFPCLEGAQSFRFLKS